MNKTIRIIALLTFIFLLNNISFLKADDNFNLWLNNFKKQQLKEGISKKTVDIALISVKFLPKGH